MAKKCIKCGAPLEGFFAKIARLAGVKPSEKNPDYCNKCEGKIEAEETKKEIASEAEAVAEPAAEPVPEEPTTTPEPPAPAEKDIFEEGGMAAPEEPSAPAEEKKEEIV